LAGHSPRSCRIGKLSKIFDFGNYLDEREKCDGKSEREKRD
jgi:hypothetical protein